MTCISYLEREICHIGERFEVIINYIFAFYSSKRVEMFVMKETTF